MKHKSNDGVVNDSGLSEKGAMKRVRGGTVIKYGRMTLSIAPGALEHAIGCALKLSSNQRSKVASSVGASLVASLPKMESGNFGKEDADNFYSDILVWEALKRTSS